MKESHLFSQRPWLTAEEANVNVVYPRCAGIDVHKDSVSVCMRKGKGKHVESTNMLFGTFTSDLERMRTALRKHKIRRVVMESTGVFWIPVWNVLERGNWEFDPILVNPAHVRALPGKKTDQKDSERLAELGQYDLLRGSFIPPAEIRQLRDMTRLRAHLQDDRNRVINRIGRWLEMANIKLGSVVSDLMGKTGLLILYAIARGETDPRKLSDLAQGTLKAKQADLAEATRGWPDDHFRWMLQELLEEIRHLDVKLEQRNRPRITAGGRIGLQRNCEI